MYSTKKTNHFITINDKIKNDKIKNDKYFNNIIYKINNPRERELALYGKVIFKYSMRDVE